MKQLLIGTLFSTQFVFGASYQVPTPANLLTSAQWEITGNAEAKVNDGKLEVKYQLPEDLVGKEQSPISFSGVVESDFIKVEGPGVHGFCMVAGNKPLTCMVKYPSLPIDLESRDSAINAHHKGEEALRRLEVAELFSADPAGILGVEIGGKHDTYVKQ